MATQTLEISLPDARDTDRFGIQLSAICNVGDCILLRGQIGAGKSAIARAFIRERLGSETEVPSPTFTLVQTYEDQDAEIWHADLYRLSDPNEAVELGLTDAFETAICLIEWPELLGEMAPQSALDIHLTVRDHDHLAVLSFGAHWSDRIKKLFGNA